jgi:formylglycine-generating enzyme required for sulfatase activity/tRNA A-37 threonylcarbamoyl transferase component Bud32
MPEPMDRLNAALDGRYHLERRLGEGGMATVYLADDLKHERRVALKVLKPELAAVVGAERFLREIKTTANLQHPHILPLFDSGEADGFLFYVMPYVQGESLRDRLEREGRLPIADALRITEDVAEALSHAHARGVIHRDIKPANVLLGDGGALVADFGIALAISSLDPAQLTATGLSLGTPAYMSPEQVEGGSRVDGRSDLYSLGTLLYEMLAGEPPFTAPTLQGLMVKLLTEQAPSIRGVRPEVPKGVAAALGRAMEKDPDHRFDSVQAFREAISRPEARSARRGGLVRVAGVVVVAALTLWGVMAWRSVRRADARNLLPEISRLVEAGQYVEAHDLALRAEAWIRGDSTLERLMAQTTDLLTVTSDPEGAEVFLQRFATDPARIPDSQRIGLTPIAAYRMPRADHRVVVSKEGFVSAERIASSAWARSEAPPEESRYVSLDVPLSTREETPAGMVAVPGGEYHLAGPDAPTGMTAALGPFFIDRFEVTNEAMKAFVDAGGYAREEYWAETPTDARATMVDRTGLPGPRSWVGQQFPEGEGQVPVSGVTWYEAEAFCRSSGHRLPTVYEWEKAARDGRVARRGVMMPWGFQSASGPVGPRANFNSRGPSRVDAYPFGISPYGAYAMAGNVREWLANEMGPGWAITGGSWEGPAYLYTEIGAESGSFASPAVGFRCAYSQGTGDQGSERIETDTQTPTYQPVDEATFRTLLTYYRYDRRPANPRITETVETPSWTRERIWIDGPEADSVLVYFYAPKTAEPPYQTMVFVPSSGAFFMQTMPEAVEWAIGPLIQGGRAVLAVVMKGMLEREFPPDYVPPSPPTVEFRDLLVLHATELRLGMDYAESRGDVDPEKFAYVAVSWGAGSRLAFSAVDDRYKAVVYIGGGIDERVKPTLPEADNVNFAPYVRAPKLLVNGLNDEEHPWLSRGLPLWNLLREPKERVLVEGGGHVVPPEDRIPAIKDFLDRVLGPVGGS